MVPHSIVDRRVLVGRLAVLLAMLLLTASCAAAFGNSTGTYDSLEDEADAQMEYLTDLLTRSNPDHEIVAIRVNVGPCEPTGGWKVGTTLVVASPSASPAQLLDAVVAELELRDIKVAEQSGGVDYSADVDMFGGDLWMYWSTRPIAAAELGQSGACYGDDRVRSADPHDIERDDGVVLVVRDV